MSPESLPIDEKVPIVIYIENEKNSHYSNLTVRETRNLNTS